MCSQSMRQNEFSCPARAEGKSLLSATGNPGPAMQSAAGRRRRAPQAPFNMAWPHLLLQLQAASFHNPAAPASRNSSSSAVSGGSSVNRHCAGPAAPRARLADSQSSSRGPARQ